MAAAGGAGVGVGDHVESKQTHHGAAAVEITDAVGGNGTTPLAGAPATVSFFAADIVDLKGANRAHKALWSAMPL